MAIIQFPPEVRHPEVEEFILSHFEGPILPITEDIRVRKLSVRFFGKEYKRDLFEMCTDFSFEMHIDLALIKLTDEGYIGYQINSALSLLTGEFVKSFETVDPKDSLLGLTGYQPVDEAKVYQGKFRLYWRPQKQDPFEWLKERGLYVIES